MSMEKAYKLLAIQEGISNNEAKALIDSGLVSAKGQKITIARGLINSNTKFSILKLEKPKIIFEDDDIIAINKPEFITSESIAKSFNFSLLNRLDKETSGIVLLYKNEEFREKAIREFKNLNVKKTYYAIVNGLFYEEMKISSPILTIKNKNSAYSKISNDGKSALSYVYPISISGKKSLIKVDIKTGRTHQIRVHLASINYPIVGDEKYGKNKNKRMFLHSYELEIFDYKFKAEIPKSFYEFGFSGV